MKQHCGVFYLVMHKFAVFCEQRDFSRGFNKNISWVNLEIGLEVAKQSNLPMMILMHRTGCEACIALSRKFPYNKDIERLSKKFVMVNVMNNEEPQEVNYSPDGSYFPRILFADSAGTVRKNIYNEEGDSQYRHFYWDTDQIVRSMKKAIKLFEGKD